MVVTLSPTNPSQHITPNLSKRTPLPLAFQSSSTENISKQTQPKDMEE